MGEAVTSRQRRLLVVAAVLAGAGAGSDCSEHAFARRDFLLDQGLP
jgi:hypothetical protein